MPCPAWQNPRRHIQAAGWWAPLAGGISSAGGGSRCFRAAAAWRGAKAPAPNLFPGFPATLLGFAQRLARLPAQAFFPTGCVAALCRTFCQRSPIPAVLSKRRVKGYHPLPGSKGETHGGVWGESPKPDGETDGASNLAARGVYRASDGSGDPGVQPAAGAFSLSIWKRPRCNVCALFRGWLHAGCSFFLPAYIQKTPPHRRAASAEGGDCLVCVRRYAPPQLATRTGNTRYRYSSPSTGETTQGLTLVFMDSTHSSSSIFLTTSLM